MLWYIFKTQRGEEVAQKLKELNIVFEYIFEDDKGYHYKRYNDIPFVVYADHKTIFKLLNEDQYLKTGIFFEEEAFNVDAWNRYRKTQMLNYGGDVINIEKGLDKLSSENLDLFFIKPITNKKLLDGSIYKFDTFKDIVSLVKKNDIKYLYKAKIQNIIKEYRVCIINKKVVDIVCYKNWMEGGNLAVEGSVESLITKSLTDGWLPNKVCIMDVARLNTGILKIIEFNCFNYSNLYNLNLRNINKELDSIFIAN